MINEKKLKIKKIILYLIFIIILLFIILISYRAYHVLSILNNSFTQKDAMENDLVQRGISLKFNNKFFDLIDKTYSKKIYDNYDKSKLFENNSTMQEEKEDFFKILNLYLKINVFLTIYDDTLFYKTPYNQSKIVSLVYDTRIDYFFELLVYYIKYLDKYGDFGKSNELLEKLIPFLNHIMEKSYHFDYIYVNGFYRFIFETLKCEDKNRALLFENNIDFFKQIFLKRLESQTLFFQKLYENIIDYSSETLTLEEKNKNFRIASALYKKGNDELLEHFQSNSKKQKNLSTLNDWYYIDMLNSILFESFDYANLFIANEIVEAELQRTEKNYSRIIEIINLQEKWLENCHINTRR